MAGDRTQRPLPAGQPASNNPFTAKDARARLSRYPLDELNRVQDLVDKGFAGDLHTPDGQTALALQADPTYLSRQRAVAAANKSKAAKGDKAISKQYQSGKMPTEKFSFAKDAENAATEAERAQAGFQKRYAPGDAAHPELLPGAAPAPVTPPPEEKSWLRKVLDDVLKSMGIGSTQGENYNKKTQRALDQG